MLKINQISSKIYKNDSAKRTCLAALQQGGCFAELVGFMAAITKDHSEAVASPNVRENQSKNSPKKNEYVQ